MLFRCLNRCFRFFFPIHRSLFHCCSCFRYNFLRYDICLCGFLRYFKLFLHRNRLRRNLLYLCIIYSLHRTFLYLFFRTFIIFILIVNFFQCWLRLFYRFRLLLYCSRTAVIFFLLKRRQWLILHLKFHRQVYILSFAEPKNQVITFFQTFRSHSRLII